MSSVRPMRPTVRSATVNHVRKLTRQMWPLLRRYWFDGLIVVGLVIGVVGAVVNERDNKIDGPLWFDVVAVVAIMAPLFARRRYPFGAPLATALVLGLVSFVDERLVPELFVPFLAGVAASILFGLLPERRQAIAGWVVVVAMVGIVVHNDPKGAAGDYIWVTIWFTIAWIVGWAFVGQSRQAQEARERALRAEREREERARLAVAEERARIARELHDVVGHSVSVMTVQASAVRRLLEPEQEREREALLIVEQTGREAMAEMRRMVGVLRRPEEAPALAPQPSLEHLDKLVEQARESGLPVTLKIEGDAVRLPAGVDLTAYRLVQEGLTNALKHARAQHAEVLVRYSNGFVELSVTDDGSGDGGGDSGGHGLVGMRERISVYGGNLEAGPRPEGGFRLRATLPVGGA
jgi:signal transduction histidine kinase